MREVKLWVVYDNEFGVTVYDEDITRQDAIKETYEFMFSPEEALGLTVDEMLEELKERFPGFSVEEKTVKVKNAAK
jgi:phage terminase large subunit-like protein